MGENMKKRLLAILMAAAMCICFCACGGGQGSTEETVEITTVAADQEEDDDANDISVYHEIYDEYAEKLESEAEQSKKDLEAKADDLSKDALYDLVKEKTDDLDKIREEGAGKMTDAMLDSTDDDQDYYETWYTKLTEKYSDLSRDLTGVYTDRF